jgi:hypothetical protein
MKNNLGLTVSSFVFASVSVLGPAQADAPMPPAQEKSIYCSLEATACAVVSKRDGTISGYAAKKTKIMGAPLWTIKRSGVFGQISDSGQVFAIIEPGNCLTNKIPGPGIRFVSFYRNGRMTGAVRTEDIFPGSSPPKLAATASNYQWCSSFGLTGEDRFELNLVDGRQLIFSPTTGKKK